MTADRSALTAPHRGLGVLLTRGWLGAIVALAVGTTACVLLGLWQFHRYEAKSARADLIEHNYSAAPVALAEVLPEPSSSLPAADQWRTVTLTGHYCTDPGCIVYARNRPFHGEVGFAQLAPFITDQGTLVVARGWLATKETTSEPLDPPTVPAGERTIVVRVRAVEPALAHRTSPPGQIQSITAENLRAWDPLVGPVRSGGYGELVTEDSAAPAHLTAFPRPETSLGPHLSYAVQWWALALLLPIAGVVRARRALLDAKDDAAAAQIAAAPRRPAAARPAPRARRDEEEEDALVDRGGL